jgi:type II secretory pathway component PulJ
MFPSVLYLAPRSFNGLFHLAFLSPAPYVHLEPAPFPSRDTFASALLVVQPAEKIPQYFVRDEDSNGQIEAQARDRAEYRKSDTRIAQSTAAILCACHCTVSRSPSGRTLGRNNQPLIADQSQWNKLTGGDLATLVLAALHSLTLLSI